MQGWLEGPSEAVCHEIGHDLIRVHSKQCGATLDVGAETSPNLKCQKALREPVATAPPPIPVTLESLCAHCDNTVPAGAIVCPTCTKDVRPLTRGTTHCHYCAEEILAAPVVCKHCHRDLVVAAAGPSKAIRRSPRGQVKMGSSMRSGTR